MSQGKIRRFISDSKSGGKFWEVQTSGNKLTTRWGRIESNGTSHTKVYDSKEDALTAKQKIIEQKLKSGYQEIRDKTKPSTKKRSSKTTRIVNTKSPKQHVLSADDLPKRVVALIGDIY